jgi:hypothetical protein
MIPTRKLRWDFISTVTTINGSRLRTWLLELKFNTLQWGGRYP